MATPKKNKPLQKPAGAAFDKIFERIYKLVLKIPRGRVMTYGQIARLLEDRYSPRLVGWAMHATPKDGRNIPWHRVINSRGAVSTGKVLLHEPDLQRLMLEAEGVVFNERGCCDLSEYQWSPRRRPNKLLKDVFERSAKKAANRKAGGKQKAMQKKTRKK